MQTFFFVFSQYLSSQGVSQLVPESLADALRLVTGSPLPTVHMFLNLVFCVDFQINWVFMHNLQEWVFCSLQFYNFPGHIFCWFSKSYVLGAHLSNKGSKGWGVWCWTHLSLLCGPLQLGCGLFLSKPISLSFLPISMLPFTLCCEGSVDPVFIPLLRGLFYI